MDGRWERRKRLPWVQGVAGVAVMFLLLLPITVLATTWDAATVIWIDLLLANVLVWSIVAVAAARREAAWALRVAGLLARRKHHRRSRGLTASHFALS
jgi:hypothetical protein